MTGVIVAEMRGAGCAWWRLKEGRLGAEAWAESVDALPEDAPRLVADHPGAPAVPVPAVPPEGVAQLGRDLWVVQALAQAQPAARFGAVHVLTGFLAAEPKFDGVLCLPGAESQWLHISAGEVVSFRSAVTAEIAEALFGGLTEPDADAIEDGMSRGGGVLADLASARVRGDTGRASGLLLGAELAAMRPYWLGQDVVVLGGGHLQTALAAQAAMVRAGDLAAAREAGFAALARGLA